MATLGDDVLSQPQVRYAAVLVDENLCGHERPNPIDEDAWMQCLGVSFDRDA